MKGLIYLAVDHISHFMPIFININYHILRMRP